jgi:hypothetical protein
MKEIQPKTKEHKAVQLKKTLMYARLLQVQVLVIFFSLRLA